MAELNHTVEVAFRLNLQEQRKDEITGWFKSMGDVVSAVADIRELPVTDFTVVLADDLAEVIAELQEDSESAFSMERLGGVVSRL